MSWRGWIALAIAVLLCGWLISINIYGFLAPTDRAAAKTLVVEGWVHEYAIRAAVHEFRTGSYDHVFATGGPVAGNGGYVNDYNTSASVGAESLEKAGISAELVQMVPSHVIGRDRTYSSAIALRDWFAQHDYRVRALNVVTEDAHARRTRLLFSRAFGSDVMIGIIAIPNPDYDSKHWWRYSESVERVVEESVGYIYAKFFFHPAKPHRTKA